MQRDRAVSESALHDEWVIVVLQLFIDRAEDATIPCMSGDGAAETSDNTTCHLCIDDAINCDTAWASIPASIPALGARQERCSFDL